MVLPVRGGATIRPRWPLPSGVIRSITRVDRFSGSASRRMCSCGIERRQVLEEHALLAAGGRLEVDRLDLDQREVAFAFFRRADLAGDGVAGVQVELADLGGGDVDVVGAGEVVVVGGPQEPEAIRQHLEDAFGEDQPGLLGAGAEDLEDQLLLAHAGRARNLEVARDLGQRGRRHILERREVEGLGLGFAGRGGCVGGCRGAGAFGASGAATAALLLSDLRSSSTVHPILHRFPPRRA